MEITLTDKGIEYAQKIMSFIYRAEDNALKITLEKYPEIFIEALEFFGAQLKEEFEECLNNESVE